MQGVASWQHACLHLPDAALLLQETLDRRRLPWLHADVKYWLAGLPGPGILPGERYALAAPPPL